MSKDLINLDSFQLPAYLQDRETTTSSSLVTQREAVPRISIKGFRFRLKKDGEEKVAPAGQPLNIVVLGASPKTGTAKSWYEHNYVTDSDDPPDCSSSDGVRPDTWVEDPICSSCAACPNNEWGSATDKDGNPTKGKACNDVKQLLVVAPNNIEKGDVYILQVPPTSLKGLSSYGRQLAKHNIPVEAALTSVQFVDSEYAQIEFTLGGFLDKENSELAMDRANSADVLDLISEAEPVNMDTMKSKPDSRAKREKEPEGKYNTAAQEEWEGLETQKQVEMEDPKKEELSEKDKEIAALKAKLDETGSVFDDDTTEQGMSQDAAGENELLDKAGTVWDPTLHSSTQSKTAAGLWTKRRNRKSNGGAAAEPEASKGNGEDTTGGFEKPDPTPGKSDLDKILDGEDW